MDWTDDYTIEYDFEYTEYSNQRVRDKYGSSGPRNATHASDLFFCLRKAWLKQAILRGDIEATVDGDEISDATLDVGDDTILTWSGGLMFEDLVSEGERQPASTYCWTCGAVGRMPNKAPGEPEQAHCPVCRNRWLVFTPDYIANGIVHEAKETRKSRRQGPANAPWWMDQLRTYFAFAKQAGWTTAPYARLVVKWLMGDYGRKKKGLRPLPPSAALDAFRIVFDEDRLSEWLVELRRRSAITEGSKLPPLNGMGSGSEQVPAYDWECSSCLVGKAAGCEMWKWDADDKEITGVELEVVDGPRETDQDMSAMPEDD
jgi:hypothetical protein